MALFRGRSHRFLILAVVSLSIFICAVAVRSHADDAQSPAAAPPAPESSATPQTQESNRDEGVHPGRQLAQETREAAGEDENAKFKQTPPVQWLARHTGLSMQHAYMLSIGINFAIVAAAIFWACLKFLPAAFRDRTSQIQKAMEEARAASQEANKRLTEIESRLSHLDAEIASFRSATDKEWAAEEARIQAAAEEEARKIVETAEQEIAAAAKSARRELTAFAASLGVSMAAKQIQIDHGTDEALVRDFVAQLAADGGSRKGGR